MNLTPYHSMGCRRLRARQESASLESSSAVPSGFGDSTYRACSVFRGGAGGLRPRSDSGFTMLEIAISLAIIAFALVAIIGALPTGMNVQRDNRQETVINQDATVWMDAIRNGEAGLDDLTNYVLAITNTQTLWRVTISQTNQVQGSLKVWGFTPDSSTPVNGNQFLLTNGARIVGLLSTPRYFATNTGGTVYYFSNYIVATVRAMSGSAVEKFPQTNLDVLDQALVYRLIPEISSFNEWDTTWTNGNQTARKLSRNLETNLYNLRLTFRWPYYANGTSGNGRQVLRTLVSGSMGTMPTPIDWGSPTNLYFFQPRLYRKAS